jgi:hypothetical protein
MVFQFVVFGGGGSHIVQHSFQHVGVGTGRDCPLLSTAQPSRRDHFHGLGDLLRALDAANAAPDVD